MTQRSQFQNMRASYSYFLQEFYRIFYPNSLVCQYYWFSQMLPQHHWWLELLYFKSNYPNRLDYFYCCDVVLLAILPDELIESSLWGDWGICLLYSEIFVSSGWKIGYRLIKISLINCLIWFMVPLTSTYVR